MIRLLQLIYLRRVLFLFIFLELCCVLLIKNSSPYYSAHYFTSSNYVSSRTFEIKSDISEYFSLVTENKKLREENALLKESKFNSLSSYKYPTLSFKNNYKIKESKIISNSINFSKNYLTIDVGNNDGVKSGMGVIAKNGIIGIVKSTSDDFSTVTSLLNTKFRTSVKVGKNRTLSSLNWIGENPNICNLLHLPKHVQISKGDSVFTSGYGGVFPEEILIGTISEIETESDKSFHNIKVLLINKFSQLNSAYVVIDKNELEKEKIIQGNE